MADVTAIFGILLFLGVVYPGMLFAWWLLFPDFVKRAQTRIECTPWRTFWLGLVCALLASVPVVIFLALPFGPTKFLGFCLLALIMGFASLGAAGLSGRMGDEFARRAGEDISGPGSFLRGAISLELAAAFPLIGWFIFLPLSTILALGAATFALLHWMPSGQARQFHPDPKTIETASEIGALPNDALAS